MAPEQLTGRGAVPATDVYALGCVLYWCLTGHPPYQNPNVIQVAQEHIYAPTPPLNVSNLSPIVMDVYTRCMAKDATQRPSAAEVYTRLSQAASQPPAAQRTLVMPAFDVPTQRTSPPGGSRPGGAAAPTNQQSRTRLLIGALVVAAVAAGVTALVLNLSKSNGSAGTPPAASSSSPAAITTPATPTPTPSDSPSPSADATPDNPAGDPIGYLESMRAQIDGFIAQGQDTIDPNTGRDLQNSLADLENAVTSAQNNGSGNGNSQWHTVKHKIDDLTQKISGDADNGTISQDAADQLTGELQSLSDALPNNGG
jgi:serine/threonine protein kinase